MIGAALIQCGRFDMVRWGGLVVALFLLGGCGGMVGDCSETDAPNVSGSWHGSLHLGARGTVAMTFNLNQNNECVNGAWMAEGAEALGSPVGAVSGTVDAGGGLELRLDPAGWDLCPLEALLELREKGIVGRLRPINCPSGNSGARGTVELRRMEIGTHAEEDQG